MRSRRVDSGEREHRFRTVRYRVPPSPIWRDAFCTRRRLADTDVGGVFFSFAFFCCCGIFLATHHARKVRDRPFCVHRTLGVFFYGIWSWFGRVFWKMELVVVCLFGGGYLEERGGVFGFAV